MSVWSIAKEAERRYITPEDVTEALARGISQMDLWCQVLQVIKTRAVEDPSAVAFVALEAFHCKVHGHAGDNSIELDTIRARIDSLRGDFAYLEKLMLADRVCVLEHKMFDLHAEKAKEAHEKAGRIALVLRCPRCTHLWTANYPKKRGTCICIDPPKPILLQAVLKKP